MGTHDLHRSRRLVFTQNPVNSVANRPVSQANSYAAKLHFGPAGWARSVAAVALLSLSAVMALPVRADHATDAEPYNTGWSFQFDNDLFAGGEKDQDYTGGFAVTLSGRRAREYRWSPDRLRAATDRRVGLQSFFADEPHVSVHALEWGAALFTPNDIKASAINRDDRPYASLFFINSTEQNIYPEKRLSVKSGLTLGVLGLDFAEDLQSKLHSALGNTAPKGWGNQISRGGEPTAKYSINVQKAAYQQEYSNGLAQEVNWTGKVDLGFITGAGAGFNWRFGRLNTPWWTFNPHQSEYFNLGANVASGQDTKTRVKERYVYAGATLNVNAYNALVQGQFRRSAHEIDRTDVNAASAEVWGGISVDVWNNLRADFFLRSRTRDLDIADAKALSWGGIILSKTL